MMHKKSEWSDTLEHVILAGTIRFTYAFLRAHALLGGNVKEGKRIPVTTSIWGDGTVLFDIDDDLSWVRPIVLPKILFDFSVLWDDENETTVIGNNLKLGYDMLETPTSIGDEYTYYLERVGSVVYLHCRYCAKEENENAEPTNP